MGLVGRGEEMDSAPEVTYSVKWFGRTSALEGELQDASKGTLGPLYSEHNVDPTLLRSALELGEAAAQKTRSSTRPASGSGADGRLEPGQRQLSRVRSGRRRSP